MNRLAIILACLPVINFVTYVPDGSKPLSVRVSASFNTTIQSPDGSVKFTTYLEKEELTYSIIFRNNVVIEPSPLGIIVDNVNLGNGVSPGMAEAYEGNDTYSWRGKHARVTDHFKGARIPLVHKTTKLNYVLDVRVYNDGVAFRYVISGDTKRVVTGEATAFKIPAGSTVWYHGLAAMHYEEKHKKSDVSEIRPKEWVGPPLTVKLPGSGYASIMESGIIKSTGENFPGMALETDGKRGFLVRLGHDHPANYPYVLRYGEDDHKRLTEPPEFSRTIESPWRIVMIGADLNTLFNADIVYNVAPKPDAKLFPNGIDEPWLKPGRSVWGYLTNEPRTLEGMKNLSRLAGELGFEYHTVEGHWQRWSVEERKALVDFSKTHNVKLLFWKHSRDLRVPAKRQEFFKHLHELGVAGAKIDFFDHEAREIIDLYAACLKDAAEYKLVLNFHGANKPTGQDRTWPNEMAREGVFGMEFRGPWAKHNTTIPFTRLLAGHMDYTVIAFGERRSDTSETHQLATSLVLQSPLLIFSEHPKNLLEHKAVDFIRQIPSVWDETLVLPSSEIGEVAAFARRKGEKWFVSVINGEAERRTHIDLSFLGEGDYNAMMIHDKRPEMAMVSLVRNRKVFGGQEGVNVVSAKVNSKESLLIELVSGGGFVAVFSR